MRLLAGTLVGILLSGLPLFAQTPKLNPIEEKKAPVEDPQLDTLLKQWEAKMKSVEKFMVDCKRIETSALTGKTKTYSGEARYLKPNFASLDLKNADDKEAKDDRELMVSTGSKLYEFSIRDKFCKIYDLPQDGLGEEHTFLNFLFGLKTEQVKSRYEVKLKKAVEGEAYIYVHILPRTAADKQEFEEAELVLYSASIGTLSKNPALNDWAYLPARLWFKQPNKNHSTWTFQNYNLKANLTKDSFVPPKLPKDWRTEVIKPEPKVGTGGNFPPLKDKEEKSPKLPPQLNIGAPMSKTGNKQ